MKIIINEKQLDKVFKTSLEGFFIKMFETRILPNYPWAKGVALCEFIQVPYENRTLTDAYILVELNPEYKNKFKSLRKGDYSKERGGLLFYGNDLENYKEDIRPYKLARDTIDLAENMGLDPHPTLFSVFFILKD